MDTVGIGELKTHLNRHLKRVRAGARLLVTERGGKPTEARRPAKIAGRPG